MSWIEEGHHLYVSTRSRLKLSRRLNALTAFSEQSCRSDEGREYTQVCVLPVLQIEWWIDVLSVRLAHVQVHDM